MWVTLRKHNNKFCTTGELKSFLVDVIPQFFFFAIHKKPAASGRPIIDASEIIELESATDSNFESTSRERLSSCAKDILLKHRNYHKVLVMIWEF